jgi:hypothetical protein
MRPGGLGEIFDDAGNVIVALDQQNVAGSKGVAQGRRRIAGRERLGALSRLLQVPGSQTSDVGEHPAHDTRSSPYWRFPVCAVPDSSRAVGLPKLDHQDNHRDGRVHSTQVEPNTTFCLRSANLRFRIGHVRLASDGKVAPRSSELRQSCANSGNIGEANRKACSQVLNTSSTGSWLGCDSHFIACEG